MTGRVIELKAEVTDFVDNRDEKQSHPKAAGISRYIRGPYVCSILRLLRTDIPATARVYVVYTGNSLEKMTPEELTLWSSASEYVAFSTFIDVKTFEQSLVQNGGYMILGGEPTITRIKRIKPPKKS